jgi:hypothetical protein
MKNSTKGAIIKTVALGIDVGVPLAATLTQFPLWVEQSAEATMSGLCLVLLGLSVLPFLKQLQEYFKSPSAWVVWGIIFVLLLMLRNIIDQILVVSFAGLVANAVGAGVYNIGKIVAEKEDKKEVKGNGDQSA